MITFCSTTKSSHSVKASTVACFLNSSLNSRRTERKLLWWQSQSTFISSGQYTACPFVPNILQVILLDRRNDHIWRITVNLYFVGRCTFYSVDNGMLTDWHSLIFCIYRLNVFLYMQEKHLRCKSSLTHRTTSFGQVTLILLTHLICYILHTEHRRQIICNVGPYTHRSACNP